MSASLNDRPNRVEVSGDAATVTAGAGVQGAQGEPGIIISATEPTETDVLWADTSAAGSMVVPAGGSTGQVLAKASGDDYDSEWITPSSGGIPATIIDAKGDLIVGTAADTAARLAVGTDGLVLTADSAQSGGIRWASPVPGPSMVNPGTGFWIGTLHAGQTGSNRNTAGTAAAAHNRLALHPISVPLPCTIDMLEIHITTLGDTGSVQRLGIWADTGTGLPGTILAQGTVAADSTGVKQLSVSVNLQPGIYWLGHCWQGGVPTTQPLYVGIVDDCRTTGYQSNSSNASGGLWWYKDSVTGTFSGSPTGLVAAGFGTQSVARMLARLA